MADEEKGERGRRDNQVESSNVTVKNIGIVAVVVAVDVRGGKEKKRGKGQEEGGRRRKEEKVKAGFSRLFVFSYIAFF